MAHYWSPTTKAFYPSVLEDAYRKSGSWPADAVEVSDDVFFEYGLASPPVGHVRAAGDHGEPTWIQPVKP